MKRNTSLKLCETEKFQAMESIPNYAKISFKTALGNAISQELLITNFSGVIYRNDSNKDRFDLILKSDDFIIELESNLKEKSPLTKSSDRGNYLVYKANKKLKI